MGRTPNREIHSLALLCETIYIRCAAPHYMERSTMISILNVSYEGNSNCYIVVNVEANFGPCLTFRAAWSPSQHKNAALTSIGMPIKKIRRCDERLTFIMEIPIPEKTVFKWDGALTSLSGPLDVCHYLDRASVSFDSVYKRISNSLGATECKNTKIVCVTEAGIPVPNDNIQGQFRVFWIAGP